MDLVIKKQDQTITLNILNHFLLFKCDKLIFILMGLVVLLLEPYDENDCYLKYSIRHTVSRELEIRPKTVYSIIVGNSRCKGFCMKDSNSLRFYF